MKEECILVEGEVTAKYQAHQYEVTLENGHKLFAELNGRMRKNRIWLTLGDRCQSEISPYDLDRCRIIRRL